MNRNVEIEAAEALLDAGISLPLLRIRMPFCRPRTMRVTMRRPYWGTYMRIARIFLREGVSMDRLASMSESDEQKFFNDHIVPFSRMIALSICRGYLSGIILAPILAWIIRWRVPHEYLLEAQRRFRKLKASKDFIPITALTEVINPFRPEAGQRKNGS